MGIPLILSQVPNVTPYIQYVATSGQTVFPYPFPITQDSDLVCVVNGVTLATDAGYTLSGQGNDTGGNLTFTLGQTVGTIVTLYRDIPTERLTQISQNSGFSSTVFNAEYNNVYLIMQQIEQAIAQCLQLPSTNTQSGGGTTLTPALYANKYLSFDSNGNPAPAVLTSAGAVTSALIWSLIGPQTAAELAAGVTVVNEQYPVGYVDRYGTNSNPGITDMTVAINAALTIAAYANSDCSCAQLLASTYLYSSSLTIPPGVKLRGMGIGQPGGTLLVFSNTTANAWAIYMTQNGATPTSTLWWASIEDFEIEIPSPTAVATNGVLFNACAYCMMKNVSLLNLSTQNITGVSFSGGVGVGCYGNTVVGGLIDEVHIGVQFTHCAGGTESTNATILGLNLNGRSGDATAIGYQFVNAADGLQTYAAGGFVEGFEYGIKFNGTRGAYFNGLYLNGNTTDIYWSGTDAFCQIAAADLSGLTQAGTASGPSNGVFSGGSVNGSYISTGLYGSIFGDVTCVAIDGAATALQATTAGPLNAVAIGKAALAALTTGIQNVAIGVNALLKISTTNSNTAVGYGALGGASNSGSQNTAVGVGAGDTNTTGGDNVAVGYNAQAGTSGSTNTAVGYDTATSQTGSNCTVVGNGAASSSTSVSNEITLGNSSVAVLRCEETTISSLSDARDKTDLGVLEEALGFINALVVRTFVWKRRKASVKNGTKAVGFVAQEVKAAAAAAGIGPEANLVYEPTPDVMELKAGNLLPYTVKAIQELSAQVSALKAEIEMLKAK